MSLVDGNPTAFGRFVSWLYTDEVDIVTLEKFSEMTKELFAIPAIHDTSPQPGSGSNPDHSRYAIAVQSSLLDIYILAHRREIRTLRNVIMDIFIKQRQHRWPLLTTTHVLVRRAYQWLPPTSKLCLFMTEEAGKCWTRKSASNALDGLETLPADFLGPAMRSLVAGSGFGRAPTWATSICNFHEHRDEGEEEARHDSYRQWQESFDVVDWTADWDHKRFPL
ncbi:hypothetical protein Slin14017_G123480 [Septoria linicola]|nr:hypothetical protein Slin14017_G123480 [Septoria linicola]